MTTVDALVRVHEARNRVLSFVVGADTGWARRTAVGGGTAATCLDGHGLVMHLKCIHELCIILLIF